MSQTTRVYVPVSDYSDTLTTGRSLPGRPYIRLAQTQRRSLSSRPKFVVYGRAKGKESQRDRLIDI